MKINNDFEDKYTSDAFSSLPYYDFITDYSASAQDANNERRNNSKSRLRAAKAQREEDENKLRSRLCNWTIGIIAAQLTVCDAFVICYACLTIFYLHQPMSDVLVSTWVGSNFVEIIGILWVIARSLFPFHDRKRNKNAEKH